MNSLRLYAGLAVLVLFSCTACRFWRTSPSAQANLTWQGTPVFSPPPTETVTIAFGINDEVDVLPGGALPITITHQLTNTGTASTPAGGYTVTLNVVQWTFVAVAGAAAYVEGAPAQYTYFSCSQPGPQLAPGQSAPVTFTLGGPGCPIMIPPAASPTAIPCGMFRATLTADAGGTVPETVETDNLGRRFFFVPGSIARINIATVRNPNSDPNQSVDGQTVSIYEPGYTSSPVNVTTHQFTVTTIPAGGTVYVNAITPVMGGPSGSIGTMNGGPFPQLVTLTGGGVYTYTVMTPLNSFIASCNGIFAPTGSQAYVEKLNSKITVIAADGCTIAQKSALVNAVFECQPP